MLAGAFLLVIGANPASAQHYRPDAEAYPCAGTAQLTIVQSETGFAIREKANHATPPAAPALAPLPTAIKLGNSLTLDRRIFARTSLVRPEPFDVAQR
ncbi:hypothetical protein [Sphingobium sp.]|uniref:hypothetical protein n=1 Tax=Sphingobium sp. TaxID=1912891 RepID=UPI000DB73F6F|nr:hypothetical protein [Sphingobium sp.]PZU64059.1 MAG: hypothetical protein DI540_22010 [Sphingobium sp.]